MPPGNIARSILEYRRLIFRIIRDPSALVHPPIATLFLRNLAHEYRDAILVEKARRLAQAVAIRASQTTASFRIGDLRITSAPVDPDIGSLSPFPVLSIDGGEDLRHLSRSFRQQRVPAALAFCLLPGAGYFVCARCDRQGASRATPGEGMADPLPSPPRLAFLDASVLVSLVEPDPDGSLSAVWTTLAEMRILRNPRRHGADRGSA